MYDGKATLLYVCTTHRHVCSLPSRNGSSFGPRQGAAERRGLGYVQFRLRQLHQDFRDLDRSVFFILEVREMAPSSPETGSRTASFLVTLFS